MRADKAIRAMLDREGMSTIRASELMGKSKGYVSRILSTNAIPHADILANICDVAGYDLIAKSREDDFEFLIDPPE